MFWWLIWTFIFLILVGNDSRHWGSVWGGDAYFLGMPGRHRAPRKTDFEIRSETRRNNPVPEVVCVTADDYIENPDLQLEELIVQGDLDKAREYRHDMERIAEEMDDDESLRKYAVYGARIARRQKETDRDETMRRYHADVEHPFAERSDFPTSQPETIGAAETIDHVPAAVGGKDTVPPLWKPKHKAAPPAKPVPAAAISLDAVIPLAPPKPIEPPRPVVIAPPPPPGPVKLGAPAGYERGPVKLEFEKLSDRKKAHEGEKEKDIDPDDYTDLISI